MALIVTLALYFTVSGIWPVYTTIATTTRLTTTITAAAAAAAATNTTTTKTKTITTTATTITTTALQYFVHLLSYSLLFLKFRSVATRVGFPKIGLASFDSLSLRIVH